MSVLPKLSANLHGILYMVVSMACFTVGDMFVKLSSQQLPLGQVMIALGVGSALMLWVMLKQTGQKIVLKTFLERPVMLRNAGEVLGSSCMFAALALSSFSTVTAIIQTLPLLLTLAAALFLREQVGIHRISAVIIGFLGVLIIIRPGMDEFDPYSLFAFLAVIGMAMRDIGARLTRSSLSSLMLSFYSSLVFVGTGLTMLLFGERALMPDITTSLYLLGMIISASAGLILVTQSVRVAEISVVAPFRYIRLLYGMILGILVFGETLDHYTLLGALIVISAGLYIWIREKGGVAQAQHPA